MLSKTGRYGITGGWMRRGWVSQPVRLGNQAPTMDDTPPILLHLAPAGRHVYSTRDTPNAQSPSGATCGSVKRDA